MNSLDSFTKGQWRALWIGILLVVVMCLFPPWRSAAESGHGRSYPSRDTGYQFVFNHSGSDTLDIGRLMLPVLAVVVLTGGAMVSLRERY